VIKLSQDYRGIAGNIRHPGQLALAYLKITVGVEFAFQRLDLAVDEMDLGDFDHACIIKNKNTN
jgi:hypothetical protein